MSTPKALNASSDSLQDSFAGLRVTSRRAFLQNSLFAVSSLGIFSLEAVVRAAGSHSKSSHWGYIGNQGPDKWGELSEKYALCATGTEQSPIDLAEAVDTELAPLELVYQPSPLTLKNTGRTIQVDYAPGSIMRLDGETFELRQFHFHAPSEHLENGTAAAMEVHFVHQSPKTRALAVIGVFLKTGELNPVLQPIWHQMPERAGSQKTVPGSFLNAASLLPANTAQFYRYRGSLTTPPCSEVVNWIVMKHAITVSPEQVERFIHVIGDRNARPVQPLNHRSLYD